MSEWQLILETSGRVGKVGLARGREVVQSANLDDHRRHARDLSAMIRKLLSRESLTFAELKAILVSIGPGGYTGLRVGLTTAKVLAHATCVPLVVVPTFHAIAKQAPESAERLWVIADALQGMVYLQRFEFQNGRRVPIDVLQIAAADDWLPWTSAEIWVSGPGVTIHADKLACGAKVVDALVREPLIEGILQAAEGIESLGREDLFQVEPLYLRPSSAEDKANRQTPHPPS